MSSISCAGFACILGIFLFSFSARGEDSRKAVTVDAETSRFIQLAQALADREADIEAKVNEELKKNPEEAETETPPPTHSRSRLEKLARKLRIGTSFSVDRGSWDYGVSAGYTRKIEFEPEADSYALIEAFEVVFPGLSWKGDFLVNAQPVGPAVSWARPFRVITRRLYKKYSEAKQEKFKTFNEALWGKMYPLGRIRRLIKGVDGALEMAPGESVTYSVGTRSFVGLRTGWDISEFSVGASLGVVFETDFYVTVERGLTAAENGKDWTLSIGGKGERGIEFRVGSKTPEVVIKKFRLLSWTSSLPYGRRFLLTAGPVDLRNNHFSVDLYEEIMKGIVKVPDLKLYKEHWRLHINRQIDQEALRDVMKLSEFQSVFGEVSDPQLKVEWSAALTGYQAREHGFRFWILVYEMDFDLDTYLEESLVQDYANGPERFFDYVTHRERDKGFLVFSREGYDLEIITVQDAVTGEMFTEATYEHRDAWQRKREGINYRSRAQRFLTEPVLDRFDTEPPGNYDPERNVLWKEGKPDLSIPPPYWQVYSMYLRFIFGPRFHDDAWKTVLAPNDEEKREEFMAAWHKKIVKTLFREKRHDMEDMIREKGLEDAYAYFRFDIEPWRKKIRKEIPGVIYKGETGSPNDVSVYPRLRKLYEKTGTVF